MMIVPLGLASQVHVASGPFNLIFGTASHEVSCLQGRTWPKNQGCKSETGVWCMHRGSEEAKVRPSGGFNDTKGSILELR